MQVRQFKEVAGQASCGGRWFRQIDYIHSRWGDSDNYIGQGDANRDEVEIKRDKKRKGTSTGTYILGERKLGASEYILGQRGKRGCSLGSGHSPLSPQR